MTATIREAPDATAGPPAGTPAAFLDRVFADAPDASNGVAVSLGDRLGLYRALAGAGPLTAAELAERTGTREIYIREWLHTQVGAGYIRSVSHDPQEPAYELPDAHAAVRADPDAPTAGVGIFGALQSLYAVEDGWPSASAPERVSTGVPIHRRCSARSPGSSGRPTTPTSSRNGYRPSAALPTSSPPGRV